MKLVIFLENLNPIIVNFVTYAWKILIIIVIECKYIFLLLLNLPKIYKINIKSGGLPRVDYNGTLFFQIVFKFYVNFINFDEFSYILNILVQIVLDEETEYFS